MIQINLSLCYGFQLFMTKNTNWNQLQFSIKENARNWFVKRAIRSGIPWKELYEENIKLKEKVVVLDKIAKLFINS